MLYSQRTPAGKGWLTALLTLLLISVLTSCTSQAPRQTTSMKPQSIQLTSPANPLPPPATTAFPAVDPNYLYAQLDYMTSHFWRRESGYDTNLQPGTNGSAELASYWAQEMLKNLQGFGAHALDRPFNGNGWKNRPAQFPGHNVEITIPGALHPDKVIIIGTHYDGMADTTQSAYDDTSGCAAELAAARALAQYWSANHAYPALTLRFIIFDAEEQGSIGAYDYINSIANGDLSNIVAMIDEEQMGINYPVRFLGQDANGPLALDIMPTTGITPGKTLLMNLVQQMVAPVMQEMRALGYTTLAYHGQGNQEVNEPIFTPDQARYLPIAPMNIAAPASDDVPFGFANIPNLTIGDYNLVPTAQQPKATDPNLPQQYIFPNDTPWDTLQLMNGYASSATDPALALKLALALPPMLTDWLLTNPDLGGLVLASSRPAGPVAAFDDIGSTQPGQSLTLDAQATFDPASAQSQFTYHWDFGDGQQADGITVQHTYASEGSYTLALKVSDQAGSCQMSKQIQVTSSPPNYSNGSSQYVPASGSLNNHSYQPPPITGNLNPPVSTAPAPAD